jgi:hypothetical protein
MKLNDNRMNDFFSETLRKTGTYVAVPPPTINQLTVPEDLTKELIRYQVNAVQSLNTIFVRYPGSKRERST